MLVYRGDVAPDHCMNTLDKISFDFGEMGDFQGVSLSGFSKPLGEFQDWRIKNRRGIPWRLGGSDS